MANRGPGRAANRRGSSESTFHVAFEHGRWRHLGWCLVGIVAGALLLWKLGAIGKGVGFALLGLAAFNAYRFAVTLIHPPGRIEVGQDSVVLPDGLCRKGSHSVPYDGVRHAFFLRRAVPWTRTGPILVIETAERAFSYPRDWFGSDSDQRRVAMALNRRLGRL